MNRIHILVLMLTLVCGRVSAQTVMNLSLEDLFQLAEQNSQRLRVSRLEHIAATQGVQAAKSQRRPTLDLSLSGSYIGTATLLSRGLSTGGTTTMQYAIGAADVPNGAQPTPHWGNEFVAQASQTIYAGGAITAQIQMAEQGEQLALLDVAKNRQEVRFLIAGIYLDLCKLQNQLAVVRHHIDLTQQILANIRARHQQGTVLKTDITRYELEVQRLQLEQTRLEDAVRIANHQLVTTLHLPAHTQVRPQQTEAAQPLQPLDHWQQLAAHEHIGLRQAQVQAQQSNTQVKLERAAQRPSVALVAQNRLAGPYVGDLIPTNANVNAWFVGIGVRYSLSNLWRKPHAIRQAKIRAQQRTEEVALLREKLDQMVQADYVNVQTAQVEVATCQQQVTLANEHYDVIAHRYEQGLALLTDMLDAGQQKLAAETDLVNAQILLTYLYYKLKYTTGTL